MLVTSGLGHPHLQPPGGSAVAEARFHWYKEGQLARYLFKYSVSSNQVSQLCHFNKNLIDKSNPFMSSRLSWTSIDLNQ